MRDYWRCFCVCVTFIAFTGRTRGTEGAVVVKHLRCHDSLSGTVSQALESTVLVTFSLWEVFEPLCLFCGS